MPIDPTDPVVAGGQNNVLEIVLWGGVLVVALVILGIFVLVVRRRLLARAEAEVGEAFSIDDLETMRASGHLTDEEFKQLRAVALGVALPAAEADHVASEETEENDGNCPLSGAGPADDS